MASSVDPCPVCNEPLWTGAYIVSEGTRVHTHCAHVDQLAEARATLKEWAKGQTCGCCGKTRNRE